MSEQTDRKERDVECPCCGGRDFVMGDIYCGHRLTFRKVNIKLFGWGERIQGRKCANCGNVQLFVEQA